MALAFLTLFLHESKSRRLFSNIFLSLEMFFISPSRNRWRGPEIVKFGLETKDKNIPSISMYLDLKRSKSEEENLIIYIDLFHFSDLNTDSENENK